MDGAISFGRNVGTLPMDGKTWRQFVKDVVSSVTEIGGTVFATARGKGKWNGIPEQNAVITFGNIDDAALLQSKLRDIAERYKQDAIALLTGENQLVS